MNILILSWRCPKHPNAGGAEQATLEHAKAWADAGHEVFWFASTFLGARRRELINGVEIIREGKQVLWVQVAALVWYFFGEHPRFDLVVDQFHGIPFFTPLYVREKKVAFIHEVAKEVWWMNHLPPPLNFIYGAIGFFLEPWIFRLLYKNIPFMTVSESTKLDLIKWGIPRKNITVINNGVNFLQPNPLPKKEKKRTAIFLGALARDKGIEDAIKVFHLIDRQETGWQFWVVGRGDPGYLRELEIKSQKLKVKVKFWGYVDEKKKFTLLGRAHVLINPSVREGWGLVNIEANSQGTPVIGYDVAGMKDSVKDGKTGILVEKGDFGSLASNALKLLSDKSLYGRFEENAEDWSRNFRWEKSVRESLKLVESI